MRWFPAATVPFALLLIASGPLHADVLGRITGKITDKAGKPVPGAVVTLKRLDITWVKEIKADSKGVFFQVGLDPKDFEMLVSAPGFQSYKENVKIPVGDVLTKNLTLLTEAEALATARATAAPVAIADAGAAADDEATGAFNSAVSFYQAKDYAQALAPSEKAYKGFQDAIAKTKEAEAKTELEGKLHKASMLYGLVLFHAGKKEDAAPILTSYLEKNPKDGAALSARVKIARDLKDKEAETKYQALLDELEGPKPELAYNDAVTAFNAGKTKEARAAIEKAIKVDPKFAESYYLLGMLEFGDNHIQAAKAAFRKYMEIAPNGKKAGEVKEFLRELK